MTSLFPRSSDGAGKVYEDVELEYLLRVAVPTIDSRRPQYRGVEVAVGNEKAAGQLVEDVEKIAIETLNAQGLVILTRTLIRALGKYLLFRQANKENETLGLLVNLAGVVSEQADTRSWKTLPEPNFCAYECHFLQGLIPSTSRF